MLQNFFAIGGGTSLGGQHWVAQDISGSFANCGGVFNIVETPAGSGLPDANIALNCNGQTGSVTANFQWAVNGQQFGGCVLLNNNDGSGGFDIICGPSLAAATTCGQSVLSSGTNPVNFPNAAITTPSFSFWP